MMKKKIIISVTNDYSADQRIQRMASWLHELGFEVCVVARNLPNSLPLDEYPYKVVRMSLFFKKGKFFYLEYNIRLFIYLFFHKAHILTSNDLDTLLPNYLISKLKGCDLIYDSHEYFTEVPELIHRPSTRKMWLALEEWIFPKLKKALTVNEMIADVYSQKYKVPVLSVRNMPLRKQVSENIPWENKAKVILYQGSINMGRGVELIIEAMKFLPEYEFWVVGRGDELENLKKQAEHQPNVIFKGFVKPKDLHAITTQAMLGLGVEHGIGTSYLLGSANKIYDYIQANIPILLSDFPEHRKVIENYGVGELFPNDKRTPKNLANCIRQICENEAKYTQFVVNTQKAADILCWENEREKLKHFYLG
jgi:glycosyltransferase involved in cell wall biosynthesis